MVAHKKQMLMDIVLKLDYHHHEKSIAEHFVEHPLHNTSSHLLH
jgi:hypothetical protein